MRRRSSQTAVAREPGGAAPATGERAPVRASAAPPATGGCAHDRRRKASAENAGDGPRGGGDGRRVFALPHTPGSGGRRGREPNRGSRRSGGGNATRASSSGNTIRNKTGGPRRKDRRAGS